MLLNQILLNVFIFAQQTNVDLVADIQNTWNTFVVTGQIWAFIVGVVVGFMVKGLFP